MTPSHSRRLAISLLLVVLAACSAGWLDGMLRSGLLSPNKTVSSGCGTYDPNCHREQALAEAYWLRYKDICDNRRWGRQGRLGLHGPREHFTIFGRKEGRIFAPLHQPDDLEKEHRLAESYWQRYPDLRDDPVWGEKSQLGILGPRDHYRFIGRFESRLWPEDATSWPQ